MAHRIQLPVEFKFEVEQVRYVPGAIRLRKWWLGYGPWGFEIVISAPKELRGLWRGDDLVHISPDHLPLSVKQQLGEPGQRLSSALKKVDLDVLLCVFPAGCDLHHPPKKRVIDPWQLRHDFLHLKHSSEALLAFLDYYGQWSRVTCPLFISSRSDWSPGFAYESEIWEEQTLVRNALRGDPGEWLAKHGFDLHHRSTFPHFGYTGTTCLDCIYASITIDFLRRVPFRICKRPDCGTPFAADRRGKQYCSQYCAHLVSVRRTRRELKKKLAAGQKG